MKQVAGLALIGATMLAGCMDNSSGGTQAAPAVMTTRAEQVAYLVDAESVGPSSSMPTGQVSYTGAVYNSTFISAYSNSDMTAGVTGKVAAAIDFGQQTLSMQLSDFNTATAAVDGAVTINAGFTGANPTATGTYDNQTVDSAILSVDFGQGATTSTPVIQGPIDLISGGVSVFDGMFSAMQNAN